MFKVSGFTQFGNLRTAFRATWDECARLAIRWIEEESVERIKINGIPFPPVA